MKNFYNLILRIKMEASTPHEKAKELFITYKERNFNEADTRHKIIDEILHSVLSWPKNMVTCEEYIHPGYSDYQLKKSNGSTLLFIEAKKEGIYFNLPNSYNSQSTSKNIKLKTLLTDTNIHSAVMQVREYCLEAGCEFGAITNGHEWIIFKIFVKGKSWKDINAFVITSLEYFDNDFTDATKKLNYTSINENNSLHGIFENAMYNVREIYYPKEKITAYNEVVKNNSLFLILQPIMKNYFEDFNVSDSEFLSECYVDDREYSTAFNGLRSRLRDSLSPYFINYGIKDFEANENGGLFGEQIHKSITRQGKEEVVILFGGKGAGKSTFLKKLFYFKQPSYLQNHARIAIADMLTVPNEIDLIRGQIWNSIITSLDIESILSSNRDDLIAKLFTDNFHIAQNQELFGLQKDSPEYNLRLNDLVSKWKNDKVYCAKQLSKYWSNQGKGVIVVIDNTDQYDQTIQDFCFTVAHEAAKELKCLTIISMREERFHNSKIRGMLDAYQNSGYHITAPLPEKVFLKRINYIIRLLSSQHELVKIYQGGLEDEKIQSLLKLFTIFKNEFKRDYPKSALNVFLSACAHSNIRRALELFRDFSLSGYTNVNEMILSQTLWKIQQHQIIKPVMIPYRFFYKEESSSIPNIFQIRDAHQGSHFTALRILDKLTRNVNPTTISYISIAELKDYFIETFQMGDDFKKNIDILLRYRLVEANNHIDYYNEQVDEIKITTYGNYIFKQLYKNFTYLELICTDCGLFTERIANELYQYSNESFRLFKEGKKIELIKNRLTKTQTFIDYLKEEEDKEISRFNLPTIENEKFSQMLDDSFSKQKPRILESALKNYPSYISTVPLANSIEVKQQSIKKEYNLKLVKTKHGFKRLD